jgi:hypothetical protein
MEERVRHLGGAFQIDSRPGRGTLLRVTLPLSAIFKTAAREASKRKDVLVRRPELDTEVVWNGGLADGADSHTAG